MKPERLVVSNFLGLHELDLSFPKHGVFVITGRNGAGKSSILEAMYFALYGTPLRAPKASSSLINRNASHSTDKPAQARINFQFSQNGHTYEVQRILTKKLKSDGAEHDAALYEVVGGKSRPLETGVEKVSKRVEEIVGLKPDVFGSTIFLGQGKVTELLEARPEKRREIFDSILETEYFDKAVSLVREDLKAVEAEIGFLEEQMRTLRLDRTPEVISMELEEVNSAVREAESQLSVWQGRLTNWQQIESLRLEIASLESQLSKVQLALQQLRLKAKEDKKVKVAKDLALQFTGLDQARSDLKRVNGEIEELYAQKQKTELEMAQIERTLVSARAEIESVISTEQLMKRRQLLSNTLAQLEAENNALHLAYEKLKACWNLSGEINRLRAELEKAKQGVGPTRDLVNVLRALWPVVEDYFAKQAELAQMDADLERIKAEVSEARHELKEIRTKMKELLREFPDAETAFYTKQLTSVLQLHDLCPVCGNRITAFAEHAVPEEALLMFRSLEQRRLYLEEIVDEHTGYESAVRCRQKVVQKELAELKQKLHDGVEQVITEAASLDILEERIRSWEREAAAVEKQVTYFEKTLEEKRRQLVELSRSVRVEFGDLLQKATSQGRKISERIRDVELELTQLRQELSNLEVTIEENTKRHQVLQNRIASAESALSLMKRQIADICAAISEKQKDLAVLRQKEEQLTAALTQRLAAIGMTLSEFEEYRHKNESDALIQVQKLEGQAVQLNESLRQKREQLASVPAVGMEHEDVRSEYERWSSEYKKLLQKQGELKSALQQSLVNAQKLYQLQSKLAGKQAEREVLATLARHLGAKAFPDFYRGVMITEIVQAASDLLGEMTEGHFSLVFEPDTFKFVVITDEGQSSDTQLLSGGERVLVSLALAFAISQHFAGSLESIFVDEGFVWLDKENNTKLAEYLLNLEDGSVLVGIVTHSEDFAVNFNRRLAVSNGRAVWV